MIELKNFLKSDICKNGAILDGGWNEDRAGEYYALRDKYGIDIAFVLNLEADEDLIGERVTNRWVHVPSGRSYNTKSNPPKVMGFDDITGEPLE